jgi:YVTN family beta-propeller protein
LLLTAFLVSGSAIGGIQGPGGTAHDTAGVASVCGTMNEHAGVPPAPFSSNSTTPGPGLIEATLCLSTDALLVGNNVTGCGANADGPTAAAYDPDNGDVYVTNGGTNNVSVISGSTDHVIATVPVRSQPVGITYDPGTGDVYVVNGGSNGVSVISASTNTVVATIPIGFNPYGPTYDAGNGEIYVANWDSDNVTGISGWNNSVVANVPEGDTAIDAAYDSGNGQVYVTNFGSNNVSVISGSNNTAWTNVSSGNTSYGPYGIVYDSGDGDLYVTDYNSGNVSVISGSNESLIATVVVGSAPTRAAYDSANGLIYVTNSNSNNVGVISGTTNTVAASLPVGVEPWGIAYDSGTGGVYVLDDTSGALSIIGPGSDPVTFMESGLPSGANWYVNVTGGAGLSGSSGTALTEWLQNGSYGYSLATSWKNWSSTATGGIVVKGTQEMVNVTFSPVTYAQTFTQSGLPNGIVWWVNSTSFGSFAGNGSTIAFSEPNGTYAFSIEPPSGYTVDPSSGSVDVAGTSVSVAAAFANASSAHVGPPPPHRRPQGSGS